MRPACGGARVPRTQRFPSRPGLVAIAVLCLAGSGPASAHAQGIKSILIGAGATPAEGSTAGSITMFATTGQGAAGGGTGNSVLTGYWGYDGPPVLDVEPPLPGAGVPAVLAFGRPWPNPAHDRVRWELALPKDAAIELEVLDLQGRIVALVESRRLPAGVHRIAWYSRGFRAGVYFARLRVAGRVEAVRRTILLP